LNADRLITSFTYRLHFYNWQDAHESNVCKMDS